MTARPSPFPPEHTKAYKLLAALLAGKAINPINALTDFNEARPAREMVKLRRLGWPVRSVRVAHPTLDGEHFMQYSFAAPFRRWYLTEHDGKVHPAEYPHNDGRGKFKEAR